MGIAILSDTTSDDTGWVRPPRLSEAVVADAAQLMGRMFKGNRRAMLDVQEALSTSDFRNAAFEVLDREMLQRYADLPAVWTGYARRTTVRDFKPKKMVDLLGGLAALDPVKELEEYPARDVSKAYYEISVGKYGARFQISWESIVNDELGELQDLPGHLAIAARDTESRTAAGLLTDGNGPNDAYFNATAFNRTQAANGTWSGGSSNLLASNPPLTTDNLANALQAVSQRRDMQNRPIAVQAFALVVPPALEFTARKILDTTEIRITTGSQTVIMGNFLNGKVKLVVDPWLAVLDLGANAATTWYLVPAPESSRPPLHVGFLRGHETPDLRVKADAGQRTGGGAVPAEEGSFDVDDIQYRCRHVVGSAGTDMIATAASNGSGS
jgi:hypothetical protein